MAIVLPSLLPPSNKKQEYNAVILPVNTFFAPLRFSVYNALVKNRSPTQTATAFSLDRGLYEAMENARKSLHMSRSNFVRMCLAKELSGMGMLNAEAPVRLVAESRPTYDATATKPRDATGRK